METASLTVNPVNDAPVIDTTLQQLFPAINEDTFNSSGRSIASLIAGVTDVDVGALRGIAITSSTGTASGFWQYTLNGGASWINLGPVAASAALLLRSDGSLARLRYVPNANFHGSVRINYRAWDQTQGTVGSKTNISAVGGQTAFSIGVKTASLTINPVNDAPLIDTSINQQFPGLAVNSFNSDGKAVSLLATGISDIDGAGSLRGIAITAVTGSSTGQWQYTLNGGTSWINVGAVATSAALLIPSNSSIARLRYVPNANFKGTVQISFRAWDQTQGVAGSLFNTSAAGSITAFSSAVETASLTIV